MIECDKMLKPRYYEIYLSFEFSKDTEVHVYVMIFFKKDLMIVFIYLDLFTLSFEPRQAIEVSKRQAKVREMPGNSENAMKLEAAEAKLQDLTTNMNILGKEAAAALAAVEAQQQRLTLQRLIAMVLQFFFTTLYLFSLMKFGS
jgi:signal transduction histidine kinase